METHPKTKSTESETLLSKVVVFWEKATKKTGEHQIIGYAIVMGAGALAWLDSHSAELLLLMAMATNCAALAVMTSRRVARKHRKHVFYVAIALCALGLLCLVPGVRRMINNAPPPGVVQLSQGDFVDLLELASRGSLADRFRIEDSLKRLAEAIQRQHRRHLGIKVEVAVPHGEVLVMKFDSGWTSPAYSREYPIPTKDDPEPGQSSIAGRCWASNNRVVDLGGANNPDHLVFDDPADAACGKSRNIVSTPIRRSGSREKHPLAVITIASPEPDQFGPADYDLVDRYAAALAYCFERAE